MRARPWIWAALAVCAAALSWVASGIGPMEDAPNYGGHYYESLVDGFLHGRTSMEMRPAPQLLQLTDPYDPAQNYPYRLSDASLYRGRYYLYYGPTPAVVLMLPWRVLTGRHLPERIACVVFSVAALAGLGALLLGLRGRNFPRAGDLTIALILLVAMHAAWLPVTLRRPGFWELPHTAALACLWWTLYALWRLRLAWPRMGWALAVGAGLALLVGSRPTYVFGGGVLALLAAAPPGWLARRLGTLGLPAEPPRGWRAALGVALTLGAGAAALVLYNVVRFGRAGEFGQSYQLLNVPELHVQHFRADFIPFNAWVYLASIPELSPYFPFVKTLWLGSMPAGYQLTEEMHGAFLAMPVHVFGWLALAWAWHRRREPVVLPAAVMLAGAALTSLLAAGVLFSWAGACSRYLTELTGGWTVVTSVGLLALFTPGGGSAGSWRRPLRVVALAASAWTVAYVWLASFEHGGLFRATNPEAYAALARPLDYPSLWAARRAAAAFGPVDLTVHLGPFHGPDSSTLLASGRQDMMNRLVLQRIDPGHARLALMQNDSVVAIIPRLDLASTALTVRVDAPWLYPPAESPYWDADPDPADRRERQTRFALAAAGQTAVAHSAYALDPTSFAPFVLTAGKGTGAWVASMNPVGDAPR